MNATRLALQGLNLKASSAQRILSCRFAAAGWDAGQGPGLVLPRSVRHDRSESTAGIHTVRQVQQGLAQQTGQPHPCRGR
jgi:hypothetical protein